MFNNMIFEDVIFNREDTRFLILIIGIWINLKGRNDKKVAYVLQTRSFCHSPGITLVALTEK